MIANYYFNKVDCMKVSSLDFNTKSTSAFFK